MIYRLENPSYGKPTVSTLKRIAAAFDVALIVRFVPFGQLIDWATGTPFVDNGLSPESLAVPSFSEEARVSLGSIPSNINVAAHTHTVSLGGFSGNEWGMVPGAGGELTGQQVGA